MHAQLQCAYGQLQYGFVAAVGIAFIREMITKRNNQTLYYNELSETTLHDVMARYGALWRYVFYELRKTWNYKFQVLQDFCNTSFYKLQILEDFRS